MEELLQRSRRVPDDTCNYTIHFSNVKSSRPELQATCLSIESFARKLSSGPQVGGGDYIWGAEEWGFKLEVKGRPAAKKGSEGKGDKKAGDGLERMDLDLSEENRFQEIADQDVGGTGNQEGGNQEGMEYWLEGSTRVGESIEDEWWILYLLREVSNVWKDAIIGIQDNDGQFLLIEAAEDLPKWVTPENAENRVWIHEGELHLVPLTYSSTSPSSDLEQDPGFITIEDAHAAIRTSPSSTLAPSGVSQAVWSRISEYPGKIAKEHMHWTLAYLSEDASKVLREASDGMGLVSLATLAFWERDPDGLKACQTMSRFPPAAIARPSETAHGVATPGSSATLTRVKLTRPLYGQLLGQKFYPPRPFDKVKWMDGAIEGTKEWRRREVGMKLMCGLEMLYALTRSSLRTTTVNLHGSEQATTSTPEYETFLRTLEKSGYFQGELRGSKLWNGLEEKARAQWLELEQGEASSAPRKPAFAQRVEAVVTSEKAKEASGAAPAPPPSADLDSLEDSEDWLAMGEDQLDEILKSRGPTSSAFKGADAMEGVQSTGDEALEDEIARAKAERLEGLAENVQRFVEGKGELEGALFEDELDEDFMDDEDEDEDEAGPSMTTEERQAAMDKLVPSLPPDEWGLQNQQTKKPSPSKHRLPTLTPEKYEGASDDSDSDNEMGGNVDGEEGEDTAQVEGDEQDDVDMDMEAEEFLSFTRDALGLSQEQYDDILRSRKERGAFVPTAVPPKPKPRSAKDAATAAGPSKASASTSDRSVRFEVPPSGASGSSATDGVPAPSVNPPPTSLPPRTDGKDRSLDSFEALMQAMDVELQKARERSQKEGNAPSATRKGKAKSAAAPTRKEPSKMGATVEDEDEVGESTGDEGAAEDDEEAQLQAELEAMLSRDPEEEGEGGGIGNYSLIRNLLMSFGSQEGLAGPASTLAGRLEKGGGGGGSRKR